MFAQESSPPAEEEALPGAAPGQDGEPDQQPGAHGEQPEGCAGARLPSGDTHSSSVCCLLQVQDLEFAQIERKVLDGLKVGNECLKKMHEVKSIMQVLKCLTCITLLMICYGLSPQTMSIEEVERIMDETQDAVEYQRVGPQ